MRALKTMNEYAGINAHTGQPYCGPTENGEEWVADKVVGNKHVQMPPISRTGGPAQGYSGSTSTEPDAIGSVGSAVIQVKRQFGSHHIGMWSAMVVVKDHAGNFRKARRLILHDPAPHIDFHERWSKDRKHHGPNIVSAGCNSDIYHPPPASGESNVWQSVEDGAKWSYDCMTGAVPSGAHELWQWNTTFVTVDWTNMFSSQNEPWLVPVDTVQDLDEEYDDPMVCGPAACPKATQGRLRRRGIPNNLGVTKFEFYIRSTSGAPAVVANWIEVPYQGGKGQTAHPDGVRDEWKNVGRPASHVRLAERRAQKDPVDVVLQEGAIKNGHEYEVGIRATEIFGNQMIKKTTFRVDNTPPEIPEMGLVKDGERELAIHNLEDLTKASFEFTTFDVESGLRQIEWRLHKHTNEMLDQCKLHQWGAGTCDQATEEEAWVDDMSEATVLEENATKCEDHPEQACICTVPGDHCHLKTYKFGLQRLTKEPNNLMKGQHNRNYTFELTVTNRAGLMSTKSLRVQVDLSPPVAGAVNDSAFGIPDHDFQQSRTLQASFSGFSDPDSGIRAYVYTWASECLAGPDEFSTLNISNFTRSTRQTVTWESPGPGRYVVTAVAFNNAWSPSRVVCSDGVTVDETAAVVTNIRISNAFARPAIAWGSNSGLNEEPGLWMLHPNMTRQRVPSQNLSTPCEGTCCNPTEMSEPGGLGAYQPLNGTYSVKGHVLWHPEYSGPEKPYATPGTSGEVCLTHPATKAIYLANEKVLSLTWETDAFPEAVMDFEVGLSSSDPAASNGGKVNADILPFQRTNRHYYATIVHPPLETGQLFFLMVKTIKRNKLTSVSSFGPIFVDSTAPSPGTISDVDLTHPEHIIVRWQGMEDEEEPTADGVNSNSGPLISIGACSRDMASWWARSMDHGSNGEIMRKLNATHGEIANLAPFRPAKDPVSACENKPGCLSIAGKDFADITGQYRIVVRACSASQRCTYAFSLVQDGLPHDRPASTGTVYDQDPTFVKSAITVDELGKAAEIWTATRLQAQEILKSGGTAGAVARQKAIETAEDSTEQLIALFETAQTFRAAGTKAVRDAANALVASLSNELGAVATNYTEYAPGDAAGNLAIDCINMVENKCTRRPDIDYQNSLTHVAAHWAGFGYRGEHISYELGLGTTPDVPDVVPFTSVESGRLSAVLEASLEPGATYFNVIKATNVVGTTIKSSDGFVATSLGLDFPLSVQDGSGCSNAASVFSLEGQPPLQIELLPRTSSTSTTYTTTTPTTTTTTSVNDTNITTTTANLSVATTSSTATETPVTTPPPPCTMLSQHDCPASIHDCHWVAKARWQERPGEFRARGICLPVVSKSDHSLGRLLVPLTQLHPGDMYKVHINTSVTTPSRDPGTNQLLIVVGGESWLVQMEGDLPVMTDLSFTASGPEDMVLEIPAGEHWGSAGRDGLLARSSWLSESAVITVSSLEIKRCSDENAVFSPSEHFAARWSLSKGTAAKLPVSHFEWTIEKQNANKSAFTPVFPFERADGAAHSVVDSMRLSMLTDGFYRTSVKPCTARGCYKPSSSDGFAVAEAPPVGRKIAAAYHQPSIHDGTTTLNLEWEVFDHGFVPVSMYAWTLATQESGHGIFLPWSVIVKGETLEGVVWTDKTNESLPLVTIEKMFRDVDFAERDFGSPIYLVLRAIGADGKVATVHVRAVATSVLSRQHMVAILDIRPQDPSPLEAEPPSDVQYTDSLDMLAAVWPELWTEYTPDYFVYSIAAVRKYDAGCEEMLDLENSTVPRSIVVSGRGGSNSGAAMACGLTAGSVRHAANSGMRLEHGARYFFCMRPGPTTTGNEVDGKKVLPNRNVPPSCSNGITVDWTPPTAGTVKVGSPLRTIPTVTDQWYGGYQSANDQVQVSWYGFRDSDEYSIAHPTGISRYELTVGTSFGQGNIFRGDVGLVLDHVVRGLALADGTAVFANVTAFDYNGRAASAQALSPLTIDASPPVPSEILVDQPSESNVLEANEVRVSWAPFVDDHSGIEYYEVALGSEHGYGDLLSFTTVGRGKTAYTATHVAVVDGHHFYATVRAHNFAGLVAESYSQVTVASSAPHAGFVNDGDVTGYDADFQVSEERISAHWDGFTHAVNYEWTIGTKKNRNDIMGWVSTGLQRFANHDGVVLQDGLAYYVGVKACNHQGLCTTVYSDGIKVDSSPPFPGYVADGFGVEDADVQVHGGAVGASWTGFADPDSGIGHYDWCIGTAAFQCDIQPFVTAGKRTRAVNPQQSLEALNTTAAGTFVTVRAYNNAGLFVDAASNGIAVDSEPPAVVVAPYWIPIDPLVNEGFNLTADTGLYQHAGSVLKAAWQFQDSPGRALSYRYSIDAHNDGITQVADGAVGMCDGFYLNQLELVDGDRYYLSVTACDEADLCTTARADNGDGLLVDSTAPLSGGLLNSMKWLDSTSIQLEWTGFSDPHSGIHEYAVTVGSTYGANDIVPETIVAPDCAFEASKICDAKLGNHKTYGFTDEFAHAHKTIAETSDAITQVVLTTAIGLKRGDLLFISLKARNRVGLWSSQVHTNAECVTTSPQATTNGILQIVHHGCVAYGCNPDRSGPRCACGAYNRCPGDAEEPCVTDAGGPLKCTVFDGPVVGSDLAYQADIRTLSANWKISGAEYVRVESTVALAGESAPDYSLFPRPLANHHGVHVWSDLGRASSNVFTAFDEMRLSLGEKYVTWVRVWTSLASYEDFSSDGVIIATPPHVAKRQRLGVTEWVKNGNTTLDVLTNANDLSLVIRWTNVFIDDTLDYFEYALGTRPLAMNLVPFTKVDPKTTSAVIDASSLGLEQHRRYYSLVRAVNTLGLQTWRSSDGFVLDATKPAAGTVYDGLPPTDRAFQDSTDLIYGHWHGFSDQQSSIKRYEWSVGSAPGAEDVLPFVDVGNAAYASASAADGIVLKSGTTYYISVRAYNALEAVSETVHSNGVTVDTSAPELEVCTKKKTAENVVANPSFEEKDAITTVQTTTTTTISTTPLPYSWATVTVNISMVNKGIASKSSTVAQLAELVESQHQCRHIAHRMVFSRSAGHKKTVETIGILSNIEASRVGSMTVNISGYRSVMQGLLLPDTSYDDQGLDATKTYCDTRCIFKNDTITSGISVPVVGTGQLVLEAGTYLNVTVDGINTTVNEAFDSNESWNASAVEWYIKGPDGNLVATTKVAAGKQWSAYEEAFDAAASSNQTGDSSNQTGNSSSLDLPAEPVILITICPACVFHRVNQTMVLVNQTFDVEVGMFVLDEDAIFCADPDLVLREQWKTGSTLQSGGDSSGRGSGDVSSVDGMVPRAWSISSAGVAWHTNMDHRYGDHSVVLLDGAASQIVNTVPNRVYEFSFAAAVDSQSLGSQQVGHVAVRDAETVGNTFATPLIEHALVARRTTLHVGEQWEEFRFHFTAASSKTEITFSGAAAFGIEHAGGNGIVFDNVGVETCEMRAIGSAIRSADDQKDATAGGKSPLIDVPFAISGREITVHWHAADAESGISEIRWAVGTVAGGDQLVPFASVGQSFAAHAANMAVHHGDEVHVTLVVRNGAGLVSTTQGPATIVDWTPPVGVVHDGDGAADVNGHSSRIVSANLKDVVDGESGIESCSWGVGSRPNSADLYRWEVVKPDGKGVLPVVTTSTKIASDEDDGLLVFVTARCNNKAGLLAVIISDGAFLQLSEPSVESGAAVRVLTPPSVHESSFKSVAGHQTVSDMVHLAWDGFASNAAMVGHYEVRLVGPNIKSSWLDTGLRQQAVFGPGLDLAENTEYSAEVVLVNAAGVKTAAVSASLWVDSSPPTVNNGASYCANLDDADGLVMQWPDLFSEDGCVRSPGGGGCLEYKYSVGISSGGGDVVRWVDTTKPSLQIPSSAVGLLKDEISGKVDTTINYKITVQAFNLAGLGSTETIDVQGASQKCTV